MRVFLITFFLAMIGGCQSEQAPFCEYSVAQQANEIYMIYADGDSLDLGYPYTSPDFQSLVDTLNGWLELNDTSSGTGVMINVDQNRTIHLHIWSSITFDSVRFSNSPNGAFPFYKSFDVNCE